MAVNKSSSIKNTRILSKRKSSYLIIENRHKKKKLYQICTFFALPAPDIAKYNTYAYFWDNKNKNMKRIKKQLTDLIGHTPLLELSRWSDSHGLQTPVIAKLECFNPGGSVKDRAAWAMIEDAEQKGWLRPGSTIIEPTSGNTGVGLAWIAAAKGYKCILAMPETMSMERRKLLEALGAQLVLTEGGKGMKGAIEKAEELHRQIPGSWIPGQFSNPANPEAHARTTAKEIWEDTEGHIDLLVAGVGTGGTLCGTGKALKELNPDIKLIAVEPENSPVLSGGKPGLHRIQGIGAGFVPHLFTHSLVEQIIQVPDHDALQTGRELAQKEGLLVGISSGAAAFAALQLAQEPANKGKQIVAIFPDTGERYLSVPQYYDTNPA